MKQKNIEKIANLEAENAKMKNELNDLKAKSFELIKCSVGYNHERSGSIIHCSGMTVTLEFEKSAFKNDYPLLQLISSYAANKFNADKC